MNYLDMQRAVEKIELRWGKAKAWDSWEALTDDFAHYTAGAFMEALETFYRGGHRYAPSPSEMMKHTGEVQARRIEHGIDHAERTCQGNHVWADPTPTDKDRHRTCVLCDEIGVYIKCEHPNRNQLGVCPYCFDKVEVPDPSLVESELL